MIVLSPESLFYELIRMLYILYTSILKTKTTTYNSHMNDELLAQEMVTSLNQAQEESPRKMKGYAAFFDNTASWLLTAVLFLLPIAVIPLGNIPLDLTKKLVLTIGVALAFLCWLAARLEDGNFVFPKNPLVVSGLLVAVLALISAFVSGQLGNSFWGVGTETGTASALFTYGILLMLSSIYFQSKKRLLLAAKAVALSFTLLALVELIHLVFKFNFFGLFQGAIDNPLGKWNDLGIFFGAGVVVCMALAELFKLPQSTKRFAYAGAIAGCILLLIINFNVAWIVLACVALFMLIYKLSITKAFSSGAAVKRGVLSSVIFYVLIVSAAAALLYQQIGGVLNSYGITSLEVRPSWGATSQVVGKAMQQYPVFGSGPNTFAQNWLKFKPAGVNDTIFWNTDFNAGVGYVPTFAATTGIIGLLGWLVLLISFLFYGTRSLFTLSGDHVTHGVLSASFFSALFLWIMHVVYVPDTVIIALAFAVTGIFTASLVTAKVSKDYTAAFFTDPRFSFASVLSIVIMLLLTASFVFFAGKKYVVLANFQAALVESNTRGDIAAAAKHLERAVSLDASDVVYRSLADLYVLEIGRILNSTGVDQETLRTQFQVALSRAIENGTQAVKANPRNYQNYLSLGRVYESVVPLKIEGAYALAVEQYKKALDLNPHNPQTYLTMARLEIANGNKKQAREMITRALAEKGNYAAAIFMLSQLEADAGNLDAAIKNAESAATLAPQDIGVYFQLGFLKYLKKDYKGAVAALESAVALNTDYSNARYFLGLSYDKLGRTQDAIVQFARISELNPDNTEVKRILTNLRAGRDAFENAADKAPEKRTEPPVRQ